MAGQRRLRHVLADSPGSLSDRLRTRRWAAFLERFPDLEAMWVLDLGGRADFWRAAPTKPERLHLVNFEDPPVGLPDWMVSDYGDACALPDRIARLPFDLVFSNSVIEHVGGHAKRQDFATTVHACADRHWIQTPYRYFPVEPHWIFPGLQFLPMAARSRIGLHWPLVHTKPSNLEVATSSQMSTELLGITELRHYFPESEVEKERLGGLVKSIIAVRS